MASAKHIPSPARVREVFDYDPLTGVLRKNGRITGWVGGSGYLKTDIDGGKYYVHRIVFVLMAGRWPRRLVDHVNLNKRDNRWANLRQCSKTQNQGNRTAYANSRSGIKGIGWDEARQRWRAQVCKGGKRVFIGRFTDRASAMAAHAAESVRLFGAFARVA